MRRLVAAVGSMGSMGSMVVALAALAACGSAPRREPPPLADQISNGDRDLALTLRAEMQAEVLDSYERDDPPELEVSVLPQLGPALIGVGPGDFLVEEDLAQASSRWPLHIDFTTTPTAVRSKRLELHLSKDLTAGWVFDEVSWRIEICRRTLVIPLRLTALYARDGDRWVRAVEHVSTGAELPIDGALIGRPVPGAELSAALAEEVTTSVATELASPIVDSPLHSTGPESVLVGPAWQQEWHGDEISGKELVAGSLTVEDRRIGAIGRAGSLATVAYWVGNLVATSPTGARTRLRGSFVLERRAGKWVTVQGHVSLPVDDETFAHSSVGSALVSLNPLVAQCSELLNPVTPSASPSTGAGAGAAAPAR
jgi:hypothetical protein